MQVVVKSRLILSALIPIGLLVVKEMHGRTAMWAAAGEQSEQQLQQWQFNGSTATVLQLVM